MLTNNVGAAGRTDIFNSQLMSQLSQLMMLLVSIMQMQFNLPSAASAGQVKPASSVNPATVSGDPFALQNQSMENWGRSLVNQTQGQSTGSQYSRAYSVQGAPAYGSRATQDSGVSNVVSPYDSSGPSQIMDLSPFNLILPTGTQGHPDSVKGNKLNSYNSPYFYMKNGGMTFYAPVNGAHTANSEDTRSELGQAQGWKLSSGQHSLSATLSVDEVPTNGSVTVGQVHQRGMPRPPVMLNWKNGKLIASVMSTNSKFATRKDIVVADNIPKGQKFNYKMDVSPDGTVAINVNGNQTKVKLDSSFNQGSLYFKAGVYVHGSKNGVKQGGGKATFTGLQMT